MPQCTNRGLPCGRRRTPLSHKPQHPHAGGLRLWDLSQERPFPGLEAEGHLGAPQASGSQLQTGWAGMDQFLTSHEPEDSDGTNERLSLLNKELKFTCLRNRKDPSFGASCGGISAFMRKESVFLAGTVRTHVLCKITIQNPPQHLAGMRPMCSLGPRDPFFPNQASTCSH